MHQCTLTWGWDSDRRVEPPGWVGANGDGGVSHSGLGQIRQNSAGGESVTVQMVLVDRNASNGGSRRADAFFLFFTCICCLREVGGWNYGQNLTPTLAGEVARRRRWAVTWTRWGPQVRTEGLEGWTHQTEICEPVFKASKQLLSTF